MTGPGNLSSAAQPRGADARGRSARPRPGRGRVVAAVLAVLAVTVGLGVAFDEVWLRPLLQAYLRQHAGRRLDFTELHIGLDRSLRLNLRVAGLRIQNAAWADSAQPLIRAGELGMTFTWASLWSRPVTIERMSLSDAQVDLERRPDGRRNWRLSDPEDRGPGRIRVMALDAQRSQVRFLHRGLDLDLELETQALPASPGEPTATARGGPCGSSLATAAPGSAPASTEPRLTKSLTLQGTHHGIGFAGQGATSDVLTFTGTGAWFGIRGEVHTAHSRLDLQGRASDLALAAGLDGKLRVCGDRVGEMATVFATQVLAGPEMPTHIEANLKKDADRWQVSALTVRSGASDLAGTIDYQSAAPTASPAPPGMRPALQAQLTSQRIDLKQLASWGKEAATSHAAGAAEAPARRLTDADIDWQIANIEGAPVPLRSFHARARARAGRWEFAPVELTAAGGRASATGSLDLAVQPLAGTLDLRLSGLPLGPWDKGLVTGRLDGRLALRFAGASASALIGSASGEASATLVDASLPASLEAKLGLDGGRWLATLLEGRQRSAVRCSSMQMQVTHGIAHVRRLVFETDAVLLNGSGSVDFANRTLDLTLVPQRKQATLLALDKAIHVGGRFDAPAIGLVNPTVPGRVDPCLN